MKNPILPVSAVTTAVVFALGVCFGPDVHEALQRYRGPKGTPVRLFLDVHEYGMDHVFGYRRVPTEDKPRPAGWPEVVRPTRP